MIQLTRIRTETTIAVGLRGNARKQKAILLLTEFYAGTFNFKSNFWGPAKKQLKKESNGKCAYCEAPTGSVAHGDVEHFRPKSVYWWLAYCYENYSYACQICNQSYKSDKFPVTAAAMIPPQALPLANPGAPQIEALAPFLFPDPFTETEGFAFADFKNLCELEEAFLIDPYMFDPEQYFAWEPDENLKEVKLVARQNTPKNQRIVKEAEECLGLNREELRVLRWMRYEDLQLPKLILESSAMPASTKEKAKKRLRDMTGGKEMFTGMARYFVNDVWQIDLS
jgi:hypothetical protein